MSATTRDSYNILAVDDDVTQLEMIDLAVANLERRDFRLLKAESVAEGLRLLNREAVELLITDQLLPDGRGTDLLDHVLSLNPRIPVVVMTAHESTADAVALLKRGAADYLIKPLRGADIQHVVLRCHEQTAQSEEQREMLEAIAEAPVSATLIRTESERMRSVLSVVARAARSSATVLIEGESGTGKELVARLLHEAGPRRAEPMVTVNCAALPETLIEAELFGSKKGAYTGSVESRVGRFQEAHGGTLFIDEVGEVPLGTQVKLLRAIQNREFQPVGSNATVRFDARIVAATNRDLQEMVEKGEFREDLYYRLRVIDLRLPSLRERKVDIPLLLDQFLSRFGEQNGKPEVGLSRTARAALMRYDYPGNVRELENAVEHAVVLSRGQLVELSDLPGQIRSALSEDAHRTDRDESLLDRELETLERRLINSALEESGGNQSEASRKLGISERRLRSRLERLGLR